MNLKEAKLNPQSRRYYFFLNPYKDAAFTKCPECNDYLIMGTLEKRDWRNRDKVIEESQEAIERMYIFKDVLDFEPVHYGWYPAKE